MQKQAIDFQVRQWFYFLHHLLQEIIIQDIRVMTPGDKNLGDKTPVHKSSGEKTQEGKSSETRKLN